MSEPVILNKITINLTRGSFNCNFMTQRRQLTEEETERFSGYMVGAIDKILSELGYTDIDEEQAKVEGENT